MGKENISGSTFISKLTTLSKGVNLHTISKSIAQELRLII